MFAVTLTFIPLSTSDQTFSVTLQLFPPPREDVDLQDPSAAKCAPIIVFCLLFAMSPSLNIQVDCCDCVLNGPTFPSSFAVIITQIFLVWSND